MSQLARETVEGTPRAAPLRRSGPGMSLAHDVLLAVLIGAALLGTLLLQNPPL